MLYIKVVENDITTAVEAHSSPVFVYQQNNGTKVRCSELKAQGILSIDGNEVYQLEGKETLSSTTKTAVVITTTEYLSLIDTLGQETATPEDPEDTAPEASEDVTEEEILTRAELTAKVAMLEEELAATKILLGVE